MSYLPEYATQAPDRADIDALPGKVLVEFGAPWCPHCQRAQVPLQEALEATPEVRHIKVEDGRGQRLGRSFSVKLWPTLILLHDGREVARAVRPTTRSEVDQVLKS